MFCCKEEQKNGYEVRTGFNDSMNFISVLDCNGYNVFTLDTRRGKLSMFIDGRLLTQKFSSELPMGLLNGTVKRAALRKAFLKRYKKTMAS